MTDSLLLKTPSQDLRKPSRSSHGVCVGYLSVTCSCAVLGALNFLGYLLSPELLILTLFPLSFA
jgi:hypothetical protein